MDIKQFGKYKEIAQQIFNSGGKYYPLSQELSTEALLSIVGSSFTKFKVQSIDIYCCEKIWPWLALQLPESFHGFLIRLIPVKNEIPFQFFICPTVVDLFSDEHPEKKILVAPAYIQSGVYMDYWPSGEDALEKFLNGEGD